MLGASSILCLANRCSCLAYDLLLLGCHGKEKNLSRLSVQSNSLLAPCKMASLTSMSRPQTIPCRRLARQQVEILSLRT